MRLKMSGIEIEPFRLSWVQLLIAAAVVGGYGVSMATVVTNQSSSTRAIQELTKTTAKLNETLIKSEEQRKNDRRDIERIELLSLDNRQTNEKQSQQILQLQIITGVKK